MRTKRIATICILTALLVSAAAGCTDKNDTDIKEPGQVIVYEKGSWEENTYTNEFFGFTFETDEKTEAMSDESIRETFSETDAAFLPDEIDMDHPFLIDTVLKDSRHNICLIIMVTEPHRIWGVEMTKEDCAAELINGLGTESLSETDTVTLYGKDFVHFTEGDPETVCNAYYVGEKDGFALIFICSAYESQNPDMTGFMQSITAVSTGTDQQ